MGRKLTFKEQMRKDFINASKEMAKEKGETCLLGDARECFFSSFKVFCTVILIIYIKAKAFSSVCYSQFSGISKNMSQ